MPKKNGFRWGFQWGKVTSGGGMFLVGGGITLAGWFADRRILIWAVALAVVGFFTMINGLMGEDGVW